MRIIAGKYRGRRLHVPKGLDVRPTADRIKEAVFSILTPRLQGADVMDIFAGAGALGLEALSRGARRCVFVDSDPRSIETVRRNAETVGVLDAVRIIRADVARGPSPLSDLEGGFDLIFLDPPYGTGLAAQALALVDRAGLAAENALAVVEHARTEDLAGTPAGWTVQDVRTYGRTRISFLAAP
jgi:16S rRNA (guanine966-N2)-methyltransferase